MSDQHHESSQEPISYAHESADEESERLEEEEAISDDDADSEASHEPPQWVEMNIEEVEEGQDQEEETASESDSDPPNAIHNVAEEHPESQRDDIDASNNQRTLPIIQTVDIDKELPLIPGGVPTEHAQEPGAQDGIPNGQERVEAAPRPVPARNTPVSSTVFVVTALESIRASREAKKSKDLADAVPKALANIKSEHAPIDPEVIFKPLQLASRTFSIPLQVTALDCIGKLISYSYFAFPSAQGQASEEQPTPLIERAIETICDCFENEATPVDIQQQIVKSLLAAVLNDKIIVHGAGLLKAVRQIYNIFLYSKSSQNQQVAQGSLTQMVATVFDRVRIRLDLKETRLREQEDARPEEGDGSMIVNDGAEMNGLQGPEEGRSFITDDKVMPKDRQEKMTLQSFENTKNLDDGVVADNAPTTVTRARPDYKPSRSSPGDQSKTSLPDDPDDSHSEDEEDETYIRDAFLVFRALCKLSQKVLTHDQQQDLRSQNMRSKLLSLHLIHHLINNHTMIFTSHLSTIRSGSSGEVTAFMQVAKPHLCLSLSRNASSAVPRVFEVCCETFWISWKHLRVMLKKELEVFLKEVYLAVLEKRSAPLFQKQAFMDVLERFSAEPRALVETYLNYDCDRTALDNMFQIIIEQLSKMCSAPVSVTPLQQQQYHEHQPKPPTSGNEWHQKGSLLPGLSIASISQAPPQQQTCPPEFVMRQQSLRCLVEILGSLDNWSSHGAPDGTAVSRNSPSKSSMDDSRDSLEAASMIPPSPRIASGSFENGTSTPIAEDDPSQIEKIRQRKTALNEAIKQFNFKPKRGIKALINHGFIKSPGPVDVARFLLGNDRLDKAMIGEYLGEGDEQNVAYMHAFVDLMEFSKRRFVEALRQFLQSFRLPGEAQKIDRFMLKFAERYLSGNPNAFANADTAYVLAYSVVMLNTDQHSIKIKGKRMTPEDFIKNNRGINDGQDLPPEYLTSIYEEIASNEIVLSSERDKADDLGITAATPTTGLARAGQAIANVGRDLQREKYAQASEEMANKTEQLYRSLIRAQKRSVVREALSRFIPATSIKHVGPMFNVTWMSFLSGFSSQLQDAVNIELIRQCLEGLRLAIRISCRFDLDTPRTAFVSTLAKFTSLGNLKEMAAKNLEALKVLLDVALTEGDVLRSSWREILTCVSQLDRLQLISGGVDEGSLPDVNRIHLPVPSNLSEGGRPRKSLQSIRRPQPRSANSTTSYRSEIASETRSTDMIRGIDRIFTNTANLSSEAIIYFVRSLSELSWQEIQSSGQSETPRTYSLQKLVEISYYNMTRVRIEWARIWEVLGDHFNKVGCHTNTAVVFFALDSLRQLSMRFMEIEELPGFKFQKDFLKPFEYVIANNSVVTVKDMVLRCLIQMIQARGETIRSGWKTMFGVFSIAATESYEGIVNLAFDYTLQVYNTRFGVVITQGAFADMILCLTEFSKNLKFQKKSLAAIETLKSTVPRMLKTPECRLSRRHMALASTDIDYTTSGVKQPTPQTDEEQFWYPVLIAYQDILMTGEDLEARSRALTYLFETLIKYGGDFPTEFWDVLWQQVLYPIFIVLQSKSEMSKAPNQEDLSVWLSTTMIQALRNMITLFTHYFENLEHMLDRFLDLLALCICQENDTIARIGSNCLQQLILQNVNKLQPEHWAKIVGAFVDLFNRTTALELFSAAATMSTAKTPSFEDSSSANGLAIEAPNAESSTSDNLAPTMNGHAAKDSVGSAANSQGTTSDPPLTPGLPSTTSELEDYRPQSDTQTQAPVVTASRRKFFNKIINNCVLQLLMIETVNELFSNETVYNRIPSSELLRLMSLLKKSYQFAKKFNGDKDLRMALWRQGFMKQPPNLLKQESGSANTYVQILLRMYHDETEERKSSRADIEGALVP